MSEIDTQENVHILQVGMRGLSPKQRSFHDIVQSQYGFSENIATALLTHFSLEE